jgi:hypothetical protein
MPMLQAFKGLYRALECSTEPFKTNVLADIVVRSECRLTSRVSQSGVQPAKAKPMTDRIYLCPAP